MRKSYDSPQSLGSVRNGQSDLLNHQSQLHVFCCHSLRTDSISGVLSGKLDRRHGIGPHTVV